MREVIDNIINSIYMGECYQKEHSRIYKIHKYWARKPWYIVEKYINEYSNSGDIVMDPFCGSGCTGLEATINGRNFRGQDLNPTALQVTRGTLLNNIDFDSLEKDLKLVETLCKDKIMSLYLAEQKCERCGSNMYFKYVNIGPKFEGNYSGAIYCDSCKGKSLKRNLTTHEVQIMKDYENLEIKNYYPHIKFPNKFYKDRFSYKGILTVGDMYTRRNLYGLTLLFDAIKNVKEENKELIMLAFTNTVLHVSKLKGENVRPLGVNNYWIPDDYFEENVWFRFADRATNLINAKKQQLIREKEKTQQGISYGSGEVIKKSALNSMGEECIDYIFTDPPYGDAIQYSELSYIWNAWLGETYEIQDEVIINPVQGKGSNEFQTLLSKALDNIYQALKTEHYFTLCFQNKNSGIWKAIITHCKNLGFKLVDVSIYDTYGSPFNKNWSNFSPKSDIYVTFKKTNVEQTELYNKEETIESIIREISEYMKEKEISPDNNKIYDLTIAYLIWAIYLNEYEIDVKDFDIKKFVKIVQNVLEESSSGKQ